MFSFLLLKKSNLFLVNVFPFWLRHFVFPASKRVSEKKYQRDRKKNFVDRSNKQSAYGKVFAFFFDYKHERAVIQNKSIDWKLKLEFDGSELVLHNYVS